MTSVDPAVPPAERPTDLPTARSAEQLGGFAVLQLTAWCALVLVAVNHALALLGALVGGVAPDLAVTGVVLAAASWIAAGPVFVVGWPLGVLTVWLLSREPRERWHVAVFAAVGAVAAVLLGLVGAADVPRTSLLLVLAAEGALGAGGGRWLLGRSRRARAARDRADERLGAPAVAA